MLIRITALIALLLNSKQVRSVPRVAHKNYGFNSCFRFVVNPNSKIASRIIKPPRTKDFLRRLPAKHPDPHLLCWGGWRGWAKVIQPLISYRKYSFICETAKAHFKYNNDAYLSKTRNPFWSGKQAGIGWRSIGRLVFSFRMDWPFSTVCRS